MFRRSNVVFWEEGRCEIKEIWFVVWFGGDGWYDFGEVTLFFRVFVFFLVI